MGMSHARAYQAIDGFELVGLCTRNAAARSKAIRDEVDLSEHLEDAINSLRIVFAADESMRTGEVVRL
jgi:hypothetical protein